MYLTHTGIPFAADNFKPMRLVNPIFFTAAHTRPLKSSLLPAQKRNNVINCACDQRNLFSLCYSRTKKFGATEKTEGKISRRERLDSASSIRMWIYIETGGEKLSRVRDTLSLN